MALRAGAARRPLPPEGKGKSLAQCGTGKQPQAVVRTALLRTPAGPRLAGARRDGPRDKDLAEAEPLSLGEPLGHAANPP